jgi:hypothetical protein
MNGEGDEFVIPSPVREKVDHSAWIQLQFIRDVLFAA